MYIILLVSSNLDLRWGPLPCGPHLVPGLFAKFNTELWRSLFEIIMFFIWPSKNKSIPWSSLPTSTLFSPQVAVHYIQSTLDISEAYGTIFYKFKLPEVQINWHFRKFGLVKKSPMPNYGWRKRSKCTSDSDRRFELCRIWDIWVQDIEIWLYFLLKSLCILANPPVRQGYVFISSSPMIPCNLFARRQSSENRKRK